MQLEKLLEERNKLIEQHESKEQELKTVAEGKQAEIGQCQKRIQELETSLEESKGVLETNEHGNSGMRSLGKYF